jgi:hypothetical protein
MKGTKKFTIVSKEMKLAINLMKHAQDVLYPKNQKILTKERPK